MKVEVRRNRDDKKPIIVEFDFGKSAKEAVEKFNTDSPYGDVVHDFFLSQAKIQLRAFVLEQQEAGVKGNLLQAAVDAWKPEIKHMGKPPLEKARATVRKLSPEEREALLKELQAAL